MFPMIGCCVDKLDDSASRTVNRPQRQCFSPGFSMGPASYRRCVGLTGDEAKAGHVFGRVVNAICVWIRTGRCSPVKLVKAAIDESRDLFEVIELGVEICYVHTCRR